MVAAEHAPSAMAATGAPGDEPKKSSMLTKIAILIVAIGAAVGGLLASGVLKHH